MPRSADLLDSLRALDAHFASLAPRPQVAIELGARLRADVDASGGPFGGLGIRLSRPLMLGLALSGIALTLHGESASAPHAEPSPEATASVPEPSPDPSEVRPTDAPRRDDPRWTEPRLDAPLPKLPIHRASTPLIAPESPPTFERYEPELPSSVPPPEHSNVRPGPGGTMVQSGHDGGAEPTKERRVSSSPAPSSAPVARPSGPSPTSRPSPPPGQGNPTGECRTTDEWNQEATMRCKERGLPLAQATFVESCGDGRYRGVVEQCADPQSNSPQKCSSIVLGDGQSCVDYGQLKELAATTCAAQGLPSISDVSFSTDACDGGAKTATILCCEAPSNPESCPVAVVGNGSDCMSSAQVDALAADACSALGPLVPTDISLGADCVDGRSTTAKISCCMKGTQLFTPPPAPPNQPLCTATVVGPDVGCVDSSELEALAAEACSAQGPFQVSDVSPLDDCSDGTSTAAKVVCCSPGC